MSATALYNEKQLLLEVSEGDESAFGELYRHFYPQLSPLVTKYANSGVEAEEILQETFLKVWLNRDKLPEIENFRAWVFKIASREYLMALRKKLHYEERLNNYSGATDATHTPVSPFEAVHVEAIRKCVLEAVSKLPPQRKAIYEMSRNQGLKINEIAEKLSITPRTVKNVLFIVLKYIREYLADAGYGPLAFIIFFTII